MSITKSELWKSIFFLNCSYYYSSWYSVLFMIRFFFFASWYIVIIKVNIFQATGNYPNEEINPWERHLRKEKNLRATPMLISRYILHTVCWYIMLQRTNYTTNSRLIPRYILHTVYWCTMLHHTHYILPTNKHSHDN